jgi:Copper type II ascorbate-dependent monooxygenase, C-terminal domain
MISLLRILGLPKIRQQPYTINPGDSFVTKFWFDSQNGTTFGKSSSQEMNEAFLLYYPAKRVLDYAPWGCTYNAPLGICNSSMSTRALTSTLQLERVFGSNPAQCSAKATLPDDIVLSPTSDGHALVSINPVITFIFFSVLSKIGALFC